jgi:hypothetical protein
MERSVTQRRSARMNFVSIVADRDAVHANLGTAFATDRVRLSSPSAATTRDASTVTPVPSRPERTP